MASRLATALESGLLDEWTEKRWAGLWLSVPRNAPYAAAIKAWDTVFRSIPAFERAVGNNWEALSLQQLTTLKGDVFVAPLVDEKSNDVVKAALHFLRNTSRNVIRGIRRDNTWLKFAPVSYGTTADLITAVFASELPPLVRIIQTADKILNEIPRTAPLFTGPPLVDLVRFGKDSPPVLRLKSRLVINTDHPKGNAIATDALRENHGPTSLIAIAARHAYEQLSEVAAAVKSAAMEPEVLSPIRRRFIRRHLQ